MGVFFTSTLLLVVVECELLVVGRRGWTSPPSTARHPGVRIDRLDFRVDADIRASNYFNYPPIYFG